MGKRTSKKPARTTTPTPSRLGFTMPGGGAWARMPVHPEWRGTSMQVCGLWPFGIGAGAPMIGVPLGTNLLSGSTVCFDPISWFQRASLISNPSAFVLGLPGLGKSTIVRRMITGLEAFGTHTMVLGDLKPDHVSLIAALGGQVISVGHGYGALNPLDLTSVRHACAQLPKNVATSLMSEAKARQLDLLMGLVQLVRRSRPSERDHLIVSRALSVLNDRSESQIVISDVLDVIREAPDEIREVAMDRGDMSRYRQVTEDIEISLMTLSSGVFGEVFGRKTTTAMRLDRSVVFDISSMNDLDTGLKAATLLVCWSYGFAQVDLAHTLSEHGLAPRRQYLLVMDEAWQVMRAGDGMVDRIDALTRLNRAKGVGNIMITHTMKDLESLPLPEDRMKAKGFIERAGAVIMGGLPGSDLASFEEVMSLSGKEREMVASWSSPPSWDSKRGEVAAPPGQGKFLIKVGGRPGIPTQVRLTHYEREVNDTNLRWHP